MKSKGANIEGGGEFTTPRILTLTVNSQFSDLRLSTALRVLSKTSVVTSSILLHVGDSQNEIM